MLNVQISEEWSQKISFFYETSADNWIKHYKNTENSENTHLTRKPRKVVWIRIAAHSCRTARKSLGGARTTLAIAAVKASRAGEELLDPSEPDLRLRSPEELRQSLHFLLFPRILSCLDSSTVVNKAMLEPNRQLTMKWHPRLSKILGNSADRQSPVHLP